ncbi:hypothetical protein [Amycolatopsis eburnea]|uniref:Uncharacterized protein n=1 Tax=Amycolatopsis eburnea TaxID=2267691 RepID=A0A3R9FHB2_9PSEU|nr:hypothetical protein [Amycolatopsis eburnea]RSD26429.1 hypothetical protein EIY87_00135 [Amycolatopsis eburnea]
MTDQTVYLVEDHTDPEPKPHTTYWAHVYTDLDQTKQAVKDNAWRNNRGWIKWVDRGGVHYGYPEHPKPGVDPDRELYRLVPLSVQPPAPPQTRWEAAPSRNV